MSQDNPAFVLHKAGKVSIEQRPIPDVKDPYDVIIDVKYTGICGSDVHYFVHGAIGVFVLKEPMVLGHESAGVVHEVGSAVTSLKPGDRVAMEPGIPCRRCVPCKSGYYNLCLDMKFAASPPYDGTLSRYYRMSEDFCYKLPENMSLEEGALVEPTAVGVHIARQANIQPGDSVVVFGAGPVGLLCCAVARAYGATKVITVDIVESRVKFALEFAATHTFTARKESSYDSAQRLKKECDLGDGADVVLEASGAVPCIQTGIHALRMGGTFVQGGLGKPDIEFPIGATSQRELNVKGSFRYNEGDYRLAIQLISSGQIPAKKLITNKVPFTDAEQAFKDVQAQKGIKTLIEGPVEKNQT